MDTHTETHIHGQHIETYTDIHGHTQIYTDRNIHIHRHKDTQKDTKTHTERHTHIH